VPAARPGEEVASPPGVVTIPGTGPGLQARQRAGSGASPGGVLSQPPDLGEVVGVAVFLDQRRAVAVGEIRCGYAEGSAVILQCHERITAVSGDHDPIGSQVVT